MSVTATNAQLLDVQDALTTLGEIAMPVKPSYRITLLKKKLKPLFEAVRDEERKLVQKHGKKDEAGKLIEQRDGDRVGTPIQNVLAYSADRAELLAQTVTIDVEPLPLAWLADAAGLSLTPDQLYQLGPFLSE